MSEGEVNATGQYGVLSSADSTAPYQTPNDSARESASSGSRAPTVTAAGSGVNSAKAPSALDIKAAIERANANLSSSNRVLDYRVDAATGLSIAMIRDAQTGVVLQQIPGSDIIALAQMLAGWSPGKHMLLDLIA